MALSGSKDYSITAIEIIGGALRKLGAFDHGEAIPPEEVADAMQALNLLTKEWSGYGLDVFVREEVVLTMVAGQHEYTFSQNPVEIITAVRRDTSTNRDVPMNMIGETEYQRLALKQQQGIPTNVWYKQGVYVGSLKVWPAPSSTNPYDQLVMQCRLYADDFDSTTDSPEFPIEWGNALIYNLAHDLASEYGADEKKRIEMFTIGQGKLNALLDANHENANVYFTVDTQGAK